MAEVSSHICRRRVKKSILNFYLGPLSDLDFSHSANLYGAHYEKADTLEELSQSFSSLDTHKGLSIVEAVTNRDVNVRNHREMWNNVSREIENLL